VKLVEEEKLEKIGLVGFGDIGIGGKAGDTAG